MNKFCYNYPKRISNRYKKEFRARTVSVLNCQRGFRQIYRGVINFTYKIADIFFLISLIEIDMSGKNKYYYRSFQKKRKHSYHLEAGLSGFLCTCNSKLKEKDCVRESYNILNEFADKIFGSEDSSKKNDTKSEENSDDEDDIDASLKKEVESIKAEMNKKPELRRFQVVESGANGIVFIKTTVPDPVKLAHTIVTSLSDVQKSKFLLRLLPVEVTCKAYIEDICNTCNTLFDKYFTGEGKTFAVVYNYRNNDRIKRDEIIDKIAELVFQKNEKNKTDLKNPQLAVLIEIIRNICCISVVPDYYSLKKYNLMELALQKNKATGDANQEATGEKVEDCGEDSQETVEEKFEDCEEESQE